MGAKWVVALLASGSSGVFVGWLLGARWARKRRHAGISRSQFDVLLTLLNEILKGVARQGTGDEDADENV